MVLLCKLYFCKKKSLNLFEIWRSQRESKKRKQRTLITRLKKSKRNKELMLLADRFHHEVFTELDCLDCANCCKTIPPILNDNDIRRLSKALGIKEKEFFLKYVRIDEDGDQVMAQTPCPFLLENNHCLVYESRPRACREYPHTDGSQFTENLKLHAVNAYHCPAVFHILERIEKQIGSS